MILDPVSQCHFDALRQAHFPPERNHLAAHVTLFHQLPGVSLEAVHSALVKASSRMAFSLDVTGVASLGSGVAYTLDSPVLFEVHQQLAAEWAPMLTRQDRRPLWPHVTVQNKVPAEEAEKLLAQLSASFTSATVGAVALQLWHYLKGPWREAARYPFQQPLRTAAVHRR
ncbi:MAG: 2'-5' RNA ligase family protein [Nocardioidaceae bacterium]